MNDFFQRVCCRKNFLHVVGTSVQTRALAEYSTSQRLGFSFVPPFAAAGASRASFAVRSRSTCPVIVRSVANRNSLPRNRSFAHAWMCGSIASRRNAERQPEAHVPAPETLSRPFDRRNSPL